MTFGEAVPLIGASGFATWFGQALLAWLKTKGDGAKARVDGEVSLKAQSDKLMFEILSAAQREVATLTSRVADLQPLVGQVAHLTEALDHIRELLAAGTVEERTAAERRGSAFVKRMDRLSDAQGTMRNEAQRGISASRLPPDMQNKLDQIR